MRFSNQISYRQADYDDYLYELEKGKVYTVILPIKSLLRAKWVEFYVPQMRIEPDNPHLLKTMQQSVSDAAVANNSRLNITYGQDGKFQGNDWDQLLATTDLPDWQDVSDILVHFKDHIKPPEHIEIIKSWIKVEDFGFYELKMEIALK